MKFPVFLLLLGVAGTSVSAHRFLPSPRMLSHIAETPQTEKTGEEDDSQSPDIPPGIAKVWEDRGKLTPSRVYWGSASLSSNPLSRLPAPPFSQFKKNTTEDSWSPKAKLTDNKGVEWTIKLGPEARADVAAPRLAWALGFGAVEGYYVKSGRIQGVNAKTDLGKAKGWIRPDGTLRGGARFKRHNKEAREVQDAEGEDLTWDTGHNPGVPQEHLSGLFIFDVMVHNWDVQRKNCKVLHVAGPKGPENWFIVSDMGASFADRPRHKFVFRDYQKELSFIKRVSGDTVELKFAGVSRSEVRRHQKIPLSHARWFRKQLAKLTDAQIQAAFDAAFATNALNRAYASGSAAQIKAVRTRELSSQTREEIAGFVAVFREKIEEFLNKIPAK